MHIQCCNVNQIHRDDDKQKNLIKVYEQVRNVIGAANTTAKKLYP